MIILNNLSEKKVTVERILNLMFLMKAHVKIISIREQVRETNVVVMSVVRSKIHSAKGNPLMALPSDHCDSSCFTGTRCEGSSPSTDWMIYLQGRVARRVICVV